MEVATVIEAEIRIQCKCGLIIEICNSYSGPYNLDDPLEENMEVIIEKQCATCNNMYWIHINISAELRGTNIGVKNVLSE